MRHCYMYMVRHCYMLHFIPRRALYYCAAGFATRAGVARERRAHSRASRTARSCPIWIDVGSSLEYPEYRPRNSGRGQPTRPALHPPRDGGKPEALNLTKMELRCPWERADRGSLHRELPTPHGYWHRKSHLDPYVSCWKPPKVFPCPYDQPLQLGR